MLESCQPMLLHPVDFLLPASLAMSLDSVLTCFSTDQSSSPVTFLVVSVSEHRRLPVLRHSWNEASMGCTAPDTGHAAIALLPLTPSLDSSLHGRG